ncbi:MAG: hypothetical protein AAF636_08230 [Pseudomonadota bacterium]
MQRTKHTTLDKEIGQRQNFCLTSLSTGSLVVLAALASSILWAGIFAVL